MAKILIVDDSALMRRLLSQVVQQAGHEVRTARNGKESVEELLRWNPDAVTLDINMPEMDGLTALSLMMAARPTPVIMVSSLTQQGALATFEALALGAVDFVTKPGGTISLAIDEIASQIEEKITLALRSKVSKRMQSSGQIEPRRWHALDNDKKPLNKAASTVLNKTGNGVVVIGASTGGPRMIESVIGELPANFPWPIVIAQHMPQSFTNTFAQRLNALCKLKVQEANGTYPLEAGHVYIGKGGADVVIAERLGRPVVLSKSETAGHLWHPSVSVLVDSAMDIFPPEKIIGVMLTGMGNDGAKQMTRLKERGGRTIAESEETAIVFGMPAELIESGGATKVAASYEIAALLQSWLQ